MGLLARPISLLDPEQVAYQRGHVRMQHPYLSETDANHRALARCVGLKQVKPATAKILCLLAALVIILLLATHAHAQNVHVLGPVTVTQGIAGASPWLVSGNVTVSWAAAQHIICDSGCSSSSVTQGTSPWVVSGAVTASWASAQHVIVDTAPTTAVTGTFWQATQPISGSISNAFLLDATFTGRIPTNGQKAMSGSVPVTIASDQSNLPTDPQGPDAQGAAQTGKPLQNGGRFYSDGTVRTFATDTNGAQQMGIVGTVILGNLPQQPFLNTTDFSDVVAGSPVLGDTIYSNSTPKWTKLAGATTGGGGAYLNQTEGVLAAPSAPVLVVSNTGGQFPQASGLTIFVTVTLVNAFGETVPSTESSIAISTGNGCLAASTTCSVAVTQPTLTGNATGYTVYSKRNTNSELQQTANNACVNITGTCTIQLFGTGGAPPTVNTASNGTLVPPTWTAATGTGAPVLASQATFIAKSINKTLRAEAFQPTGGDMCGAIATAMLSLPLTGGTVDATGYQGAQNCASDPFGGAGNFPRTNIEVIFGNVTIAATTQWTCLSGLHLHGLGDMSVIAFQPSAGASDAIKSDLFFCASQTNIEVDHLKFTGTANTGRLVSIRAVTGTARVHHITCSGASYLPLSGAFACIYVDQSADVWVTDNILTNNGPGPASATATVNGDIVVWQTSAQNRIHVRGNQISGSHTSASIQMYDCQDCDILENTVDENNTITTNLTIDGYAITSYGVNTRPRNVRIEGNHTFNCAGSCIYAASNDRVVIVGNTTQTCGQQETDGSLPVACIALNDCGNCLVDSNTVKTSTLDGITVAAPAVGTVISNNTIQTVTQNGIYLRTANDTSVTGNQIQSATGPWIKDTGARNQVTNNHILTSGAATFSATSHYVGNDLDANGNVSRGNDLLLMVTGSNFVTANNTNLQTITGLSFTFPALLALNADLTCDLDYSQQTAAVADAFGFQDATVAPSNLSASGFVQTAITTWVDSTLTASSTTTATNIVAFTPSAITTVWHAKLHIGIEQPSNASTSLFSVMVKTATGADTVTVFRGSSCLVHFQ